MGSKAVWKIVVVAALFSGAIFIIIFLKQQKQAQEVCFEDNCFFVEVVKSSEEHRRGLMFRENLEKNKGMLFIFPEEGNYDFWMKNTKIALDIIWINENKEAVFIKDNAQPCPEDFCETFSPNRGAKYVLEINGGLSEEMGLIVGSKLRF